MPAASPAARRTPVRGRPKSARCADLLEVAATVFARRGYRQTDVQEIADALGVGKASLYRRYPTKRALFLAAADHGMRSMRERVQAAADRERDPLAQVAAAIRAYLEHFDRHPQHAELLIQERAEFRDRETSTYFTHRAAYRRRWRALYLELMRTGRLRRMPVDDLMDVVGQLVYGTMFTNVFAGRTRTPARQAADILDVVFHGILPAGGRRTIRAARRNGR
jgi:AcrR family transcriptional regulator